mmetsp:Transcript_15099/g.35836  ORF Transcript_15099/g.35836 Transcript_15099/m.35836 type:complete len:219 (+) Transcript_15099:656-1312(+)
MLTRPTSQPTTSARSFTSTHRARLSREEGSSSSTTTPIESSPLSAEDSSPSPRGPKICTRCRKWRGVRASFSPCGSLAHERTPLTWPKFGDRWKRTRSLTPVPKQDYPARIRERPQCIPVDELFSGPASDSLLVGRPATRGDEASAVPAGFTRGRSPTRGARNRRTPTAPCRPRCEPSLPQKRGRGGRRTPRCRSARLECPGRWTRRQRGRRVGRQWR